MLAILFKIARIACFVGIGVLSVGVMYIMILGNINLLMLNGKVIVHSPYALFSIKGLSNGQIIFTSFAGLTSFSLLSILFKQARGIFKDISVDSIPFEMKQVKRIRKIAIFYLVISLLDFSAADFSFNITMNLVGIVAALMFWCISLIFEYGCQLQRDSDEIL